jgi:hypothetical protein
LCLGELALTDPQGALRTFIDNVAVLVVESCIVDGLSNSFAPGKVLSMSDATVQLLAAEPSEIGLEREEKQEKERKLETALEICRANTLGKRRPRTSRFIVSDGIL